MKKRPHSLTFKLPSLTKQSMKDETNINRIMAKYEKTGIIDHQNKKVAQYGDFSEVADYKTALNKINEARNLFEQLPAQIRTQFENEPELFVEFASNPDNLDTMIDMGLAPPKPLEKEESIPTIKTEEPSKTESTQNKEKT